MTCGFCAFTDEKCYCSDPPKVRCTITGMFRPYGAECDAVASVPKEHISARLGTPCLICGESVDTDDYYRPMICDKCKEAVMKVRADLEREREAELNRLRLGQLQYKLWRDALDIMDDHSKTL